MYTVEKPYTIPAMLVANKSGWISGQVFNLEDKSINSWVPELLTRFSTVAAGRLE